ncbi:15877_t:CDS:2, partial [Cetraspora pellucida]
MSKRPRQVAITILKKGFLVDELHYGPYSRYWWEFYENNNDLGNDYNFFFPEYYCESDNYYITFSNSTNAISTVYKFVFGNQTHYSGSIILGWNQKDIVQQLIND